MRSRCALCCVRRLAAAFPVATQEWEGRCRLHGVLARVVCVAQVYSQRAGGPAPEPPAGPLPLAALAFRTLFTEPGRWQALRALRAAAALPGGGGARAQLLTAELVAEEAGAGPLALASFLDYIEPDEGAGDAPRPSRACGPGAAAPHGQGHTCSAGPLGSATCRQRHSAALSAGCAGPWGDNQHDACGQRDLSGTVRWAAPGVDGARRRQQAPRRSHSQDDPCPPPPSTLCTVVFSAALVQRFLPSPTFSASDMPQPQQAPRVAGLALPQAEPAAEELGELQGLARGRGRWQAAEGACDRGLWRGPHRPHARPPCAQPHVPQPSSSGWRTSQRAYAPRRHHFVSYPATVPEWGRSKRAVRSSFLDAMLAELEQRGAADAVVVRE